LLINILLPPGPLVPTTSRRERRAGRVPSPGLPAPLPAPATRLDFPRGRV